VRAVTHGVRHWQVLLPLAWLRSRIGANEPQAQSNELK
jgi:hypothetical protein